MPSLKSFRFTEPIVTERLILRPFEERDLDDLFEIESRPDVTRFLYWEPRTRDEVVEALASRIVSTELANDGDKLNFAVTRRPDGPVIGDLTLIRHRANDGHVEIGYVFHPDAHGQGLATEAARALMDLAFDHLDAHRVSAALDARNAPSAALLERLGLRREAHLVRNEWVKGEWTDELIYAVLAEEWAASRLGAG
ncbi:MAG TPA: GNAT family protein [Acidimicrobiales bacterium]|nr:GNAT family protein [Acidimicrobiales bacterium]